MSEEGLCLITLKDIDVGLNYWSMMSVYMSSSRLAGRRTITCIPIILIDSMTSAAETLSLQIIDRELKGVIGYQCLFSQVLYPHCRNISSIANIGNKGLMFLFWLGRSSELHFNGLVVLFKSSQIL